MQKSLDNPGEVMKNNHSAVRLLLLILFFLITGVLYADGEKDTIRINEDMMLMPLNDHFLIHTTWFELPGSGRFPSNGLVYMDSGKALMMDTPNSNDQTETLYRYLKDSLGTVIQMVIPGHSHSDCMGGLSFLHQQDVISVAGEKTAQICAATGLPAPQKTFTDSLILAFGGTRAICRYFGPGHTADNIVVYFPEYKILFGGCLIRSGEANGLGYTGDAVIEEWERTVMKIREAFPDIEYVIPGHGRYGGVNLLDHTIDLVRRHRENVIPDAGEEAGQERME